MNISQVVICSLMVEALWETTKLFWQDGKLSYDRIGAVVFGEIVALGANVDLLSMVGVNWRISIIGNILTGILISRGANFTHDLFASVGNLSTNGKQK